MALFFTFKVCIGEGDHYEKIASARVLGTVVYFLFTGMGWNYTVEQMASIIRFFRTILLCNIFWDIFCEILTLWRDFYRSQYLPWKLNRVTLKLQQPLRVKTHLGMLPRETILDWLIDLVMTGWQIDVGSMHSNFYKEIIGFFFTAGCIWFWIHLVRFKLESSKIVTESIGIRC